VNELYIVLAIMQLQKSLTLKNLIW